jgi:hypothetical protein
MKLSATAAALGVGGALLTGAGPTVTVRAPGHSPAVKKRWPYSVSVAVGGRPVAARLTEQIVDPIGGIHPVQFGTSTKNITNWPFRGTFRDFIIWPASSRGIPLTLRIIVRAGGHTKIDNYHVIPKG